MRHLLLVALLLAAAVMPSLASLESLHAEVQGELLSSLNERVDELHTFMDLLEVQQADQQETEAAEAKAEQDTALLQVGENPSYTLAYPPITYASAQAGGFFHPLSNLNPLSAPWSGFAPVAAASPYTSPAAIANSPVSYYAARLAAVMHPPALGVPAALAYDAMRAFPSAEATGGYNVHGLISTGFSGQYHPGLDSDLTSLGGHPDVIPPLPGDPAAGADPAAAAAEPAAAGFLEVHNEPEDMEAAASDTGYGLFPAPAANTAAAHYTRDGMASLGPHSLQIEEVGDNVVDFDFE